MMVFKNRLALINLTKREISLEEIPPEIQSRYLGGRGMNMYLLARRFHPQIDPLGPENPLIFGTGFLTGCLNLGSRMNISAISPETGYLGDANMGGDFGAELRYTGLPHLMIVGKSKDPVYLWIKNGDVQIKDARHLWGFDAMETQRAIRQELGDERVQVACIGLAGENLVKFAGVRTGLKSIAARTGLGAVMGSKHLKAVAVRGTEDLEIENPQGLLSYYKDLLKGLMERRWVQALGRFGTPLMIALGNTAGFLAVRNHQWTSVGEAGLGLVAENLERYSTGMVACWSCPVHCRHRLKIEMEKDKEVYGEGPEYASVGSMGWKIGNLDLESILQLVELCNRYGLDAISTGSYIAWMMELYQNGIIDEKTIGFPLEWGDSKSIQKIIHMIAQREGFGDLLADGSFAQERLGPKAGKFLLQVKNLPFEMTDERMTKSFALGMATASRGACHMRSRPSLDILHLPAPLLEKLYGGEVDSDFTSYDGKGRMIWWHELLYAVCDSLGVCRFMTVFSSPHAPQYKEFSDLIYLSSGRRISEEDLKTNGERICTLERRMLTFWGMNRKQDHLPFRYFEPVPEGPAKGHQMDPISFNKMLDEYYQLHGWDENGRPTEEGVKRLEIPL
jgi:aldehyde:ferredoxin oxidoreductase